MHLCHFVPARKIACSILFLGLFTLTLGASINFAPKAHPGDCFSAWPLGHPAPPTKTGRLIDAFFTPPSSIAPQCGRPPLGVVAGQQHRSSKTSIWKPRSTVGGVWLARDEKGRGLAGWWRPDRGNLYGPMEGTNMCACLSSQFIWMQPPTGPTEPPGTPSGQVAPTGPTRVRANERNRRPLGGGGRGPLGRPPIVNMRAREWRPLSRAVNVAMHHWLAHRLGPPRSKANSIWWPQTGRLLLEHWPERQFR